MKKKTAAINIFALGTLSMCGTILLFFTFMVASHFIPNLMPDLIAGLLRLYTTKVPSRTLRFMQGFSLLWTKAIEDGSEHLVYTQIFAPDEKNLIYASRTSLNSLDYFTGEQLWSVDMPDDAVFHLYQDRFFVIDVYDRTIPFAVDTNFEIPSECNSTDKSTIRVYDPHTGKKTWERSYQMVSPYEIYFKGNSAFISGLTISGFLKYLSVSEIDIQSGDILGVSCQRYNQYSPVSRDEGQLASVFYPILSDGDWKRNVDVPAFVAQGTELGMFDRQAKQSLGRIQFSGFALNPDDVELIIKNKLLIVYLNDSNQFFTFEIK